jgi:Na+/H+ antiporter NhaD/arsenite permease-like protein
MLHSALTTALFALTWLLVAGRRPKALPIGRSAGALLGGVGMVALGALTADEAYSAVDLRTIALLLGMMVVTAFLERAGAFERMAGAILSRATSGAALLAAVAVVSAGLSAVLVNDTVCVFLTPVVVEICRRGRLPYAPYLIALATSANVGSSATAVGNPQNMIIANMSDLSFARFALLVGPAAIVGTLANLALLWAFYRKQLPGAIEASADSTERVEEPGEQLRLIAVLIAIGVGFLIGFDLGFVALAGACALIAMDRRDAKEVLSRVDWPLLLFFAGLFVSTRGFATLGFVETAWRWVEVRLSLASPGGFAGFAVFVTVGSNLVSNVPLVLLTGPRMQNLAGGDAGWALLAYSSTVAGNLTLVGSVANLIVAERARERYELGFAEYARFGVPATLLSLAVGVPLIWLVGHAV